MWTRILAVLFVLGLITGAATFGPAPAWAATDLEDHGTITYHTAYGGIMIIRRDHIGSPRDDGFVPWGLAPAGGQAASARSEAAVFKLTNRTLTNGLQPGEPTEGGLMTKTVWAGFKAPAAERIVVHTYGSTNHIDGSSALDTVLAVYRGTTFSNFARIAGNDNRPLPGISTKHSLVQFNTLADAEYRVQIGSRALAEGDISLNVFSFPPTGGLSAFMIEYGDAPFNSRDYACETTVTTTSLFCDAKFIVHNSTSQALTVTPSTTLGPGVRGPAPFSLAPGALKVAEFTVDASFYRTVRTVSGHFVFTGRRGSTVVSEARHRGLIVVTPGGGRLEDLIKAEVTPTVRTGSVNEPLAFTAKLTNRGGVTAIGCHFRSRLYSDLKTRFYRIHPATGARLGANDRPSDIAPGQSLTFKVYTASQRARDAYPIDPAAIAECANSTRRQFSLRSGLDISVSGFFAPLPSLSVTSSVPANGVLTVPGTGFAYYTFRARNTQTTKSLNVLPAYVGPFDDPANSNYPAAICRTNIGTGACIGNYASSVTYNAVKGTVFGFSVRVRAPQVATPFDPDKRRVYVNFKLTAPPYFRIAAPNIAVKKQ